MKLYKFMFNENNLTELGITINEHDEGIKIYYNNDLICYSNLNIDNKFNKSVYGYDGDKKALFIQSIGYTSEWEDYLRKNKIAPWGDLRLGRLLWLKSFEYAYKRNCVLCASQLGLYGDKSIWHFNLTRPAVEF